MILFIIPILVFLLAFFVLPFGIMLYQSLFLSPLIAPENSELTLANYIKLFGDLFYLKVVLQTLALGVAVTLLALVIGYPVAYVLARARSRQLVIFLIISPLVVSVVIRSYGWMVLLGRAGTVNTLLQTAGIIETPVPLNAHWVGGHA